MLNINGNKNLNIMKKKYLFIVFTLIIISGTLSAKHKVLERNANHGGLFGYKTVNSEVTVFEISVNNKIQTVTGYTVNCQDPGYEACPKFGAEYLPSNSGNGWDQAQISTVDNLMEIALIKINSGITKGKTFKKIKVEGELGFRLYEIIWDGIGNILVTCDQII
jgi:hypothetical protein